MNNMFPITIYLYYKLYSNKKMKNKNSNLKYNNESKTTYIFRVNILLYVYSKMPLTFFFSFF